MSLACSLFFASHHSLVCRAMKAMLHENASILLWTNRVCHNENADLRSWHLFFSGNWANIRYLFYASVNDKLWFWRRLVASSNELSFDIYYGAQNIFSPTICARKAEGDIISIAYFFFYWNGTIHRFTWKVGAWHYVHTSYLYYIKSGRYSESILTDITSISSRYNYFVI